MPAYKILVGSEASWATNQQLSIGDVKSDEISMVDLQYPTLRVILNGVHISGTIGTDGLADTERAKYVMMCMDKHADSKKHIQRFLCDTRLLTSHSPLPADRGAEFSLTGGIKLSIQTHIYQKLQDHSKLPVDEMTNDYKLNGVCPMRLIKGNFTGKLHIKNDMIVKSDGFSTEPHLVYLEREFIRVASRHLFLLWSLHLNENPEFNINGLYDNLTFSMVNENANSNPNELQVLWHSYKTSQLNAIKNIQDFLENGTYDNLVKSNALADEASNIAVELYNVSTRVGKISDR